MDWSQCAVVAVMAWLGVVEIQRVVRILYHGDDVHGRVVRLEALQRMSEAAVISVQADIASVGRRVVDLERQ